MLLFVGILPHIWVLHLPICTVKLHRTAPASSKCLATSPRTMQHIPQTTHGVFSSPDTTRHVHIQTRNGPRPGAFLLLISVRHMFQMLCMHHFILTPTISASTSAATSPCGHFLPWHGLRQQSCFCRTTLEHDSPELRLGIQCTHGWPDHPDNVLPTLDYGMDEGV